MKIDNVNIYDLAESIIASRFPMDAGGLTAEWDNEIDDIRQAIKDNDNNYIQQLTCNKLAQCKNGTGHDNFLKGILVSFNIEYKQYWSRQAQRYNFINFVSSQSTMHKLKSMGNKLPEYAQDKFKQFERGEIDIDEMMDYVPMGLELTARMTTNYLQLKTIYLQRRNHKSKEWRYFCNWIEELPMSFLIIGK